MAALLANHKGCANPERLALIFDQLQWLLNVLGKESEVFSYSDLQKRLFPWLTTQQIRHAIRELKELDFVNSEPEKDGVRYCLGGVALRQGGVEVGQGRVSNYDTPTLYENKEENSFAQTGVRAPRKAIAQTKTLLEVETEVFGPESGPDTAWWQSWETWKNLTLIAKNKPDKDGKSTMRESRIIGILHHLLDRQQALGLTPDAMRAGLEEARARNIPNENYALRVAEGHRS
jgi:hypothetical protein